ncbi:MAG TPA: cation diffusion facilitator family transporter [Caulobacteraceae bacterium]
MAEGSKRVVLVALAGNLTIAVIKLIAWIFTRSSAMLTEAIHSLVDCGDQVLLLVGQSRGSRPPDETHPLGYGMETYFWSFIVALMVFSLGGAVSIYEGAVRLQHPADMSRPWINYLVLATSALFEGASFMAAYREYRRVVHGRDVHLWRFLQLSKDPNVFSTLLEDGAAMIGLAIAALGVTLSGYLGWRWADGLASILIGLLLVAVALFLGNETRSLIAGEAAAGPVVEAVRAVIGDDDRVISLEEVLSLHLGPNAILFAATLKFRTDLSGDEVQAAAGDLTRAIRRADPRITRAFLRPSDD